MGPLCYRDETKKRKRNGEERKWDQDETPEQNFAQSAGYEVDGRFRSFSSSEGQTEEMRMTKKHLGYKMWREKRGGQEGRLNIIIRSRSRPCHTWSLPWIEGGKNKPPPHEMRKSKTS